MIKQIAALVFLTVLALASCDQAAEKTYPTPEAKIAIAGCEQAVREKAEVPWSVSFGQILHEHNFVLREDNHTLWTIYGEFTQQVEDRFVVPHFYICNFDDGAVFSLSIFTGHAVDYDETASLSMCRQAIAGRSEFPDRALFKPEEADPASGVLPYWTFDGVVHLMDASGAMVPYRYFCDIDHGKITDLRLTQKSRPVLQREASANCDQGTPVAGNFYVKGRKVEVRTGPGADHDRVINQRATQLAGETIYRTLVRDTHLEGRCETREWLQAKIVKANGEFADWEAGWVHKNFVSDTPSDDYQAGLLWDIEERPDFTAEEKQLLKRGALKVLADEPNCAAIRFGYPNQEIEDSYVVTCVSRKDGMWFSVSFTRSDLESGSKLSVPEAYPEKASRRSCEKALKTHPVTRDNRHLSGYRTVIHNNGNRSIYKGFTAKNDFGREIDYVVRCLIRPDGSVEISVGKTE